MPNAIIAGYHGGPRLGLPAQEGWWTHGLPPNDWRVRAAAAADIPPASAAGHFVVGPSVATEAAALDEPFEHRQAVPASGAAGRPTGQPWSPRGASARTRGWQGARPAARSKPASSSSAATVWIPHEPGRYLRDPLILSRESIRRNRSVEQTSPTGWTLHNVARLG